MVLSGIIPAFGIFGFYRIWIGIIEIFCRFFYIPIFRIPYEYEPYQGTVHKPEPGLEELGIEPSNKKSWWKNIILGFAYVMLGISGAAIPIPTSIIIIIIILMLLSWALLYNDSSEIISLLILMNICIFLLIPISWMVKYIFN